MNYDIEKVVRIQALIRGTLVRMMVTSVQQEFREVMTELEPQASLHFRTRW